MTRLSVKESLRCSKVRLATLIVWHSLHSAPGYIRGDLVRTLVPTQPGDPYTHVQELDGAQRGHDQDRAPPPLLQHR